VHSRYNYVLYDVTKQNKGKIIAFRITEDTKSKLDELAVRRVLKGANDAARILVEEALEKEFPCLPKY